MEINCGVYVTLYILIEMSIDLRFFLIIQRVPNGCQTQKGYLVINHAF